MVIEKDVTGLVDEHAAHHHLGRLGLDVVVIVGVGHVGGGRCQEGELRPTLLPLGAAWRSHEEGDVVFLGAVLGVARPDVRRIGAGAQIVRHGQLEIHLPAGVVEVVLVEVDGTIVLRPPPPAMLLAGPIEALHGPRREVVERAVEAVGPGVDDARGLHLAREVPGGDHRGCKVRGHRVEEEAFQPLGRHRPGQKAGAIELAIEGVERTGAVQDRTHHERCLG